MRRVCAVAMLALLGSSGCGFPEPTFDGARDSGGADAADPDAFDGTAGSGGIDGSHEAGADGPVPDASEDPQADEASADQQAAEAGDALGDPWQETGCPAASKECEGKCVSVNDPDFGCAPGTCTACALSHATAACAEAACVLAGCSPGWSDCNGVSSDGCEVDTLTTASHCGKCGNGCSFPHAGAACTGGVCLLSGCDLGFEDCDQQPSNGCEGDLLQDPNHCGACSKVCTASPGAPVCNQGVCGVSNCPPGTGDCNKDAGDGCEVNLNSSADNCGYCGHACSFPSATAACASGVCQLASCHAGAGDCDANVANGCETNTQISTQHCGACGAKCPTPPNSTTACQSGLCGYPCLADYADCNQVPGDGCEIDVAHDVANCGACAFACSFPHAAASCVAGQCTLGACASGWGNCDGNIANGCEVDLATSAWHCGACGHACPGAANAAGACQSGVCALVCNSGFADCDSNPANGCEHVKPGYKEAVLADAPVGYWRLAEANGTVLADASGHGLELTVHPSLTLGVPGALFCDADRAIRFDAGSEGWLGRGTTPLLQPANALSLELWMMQSGVPSEYQKPLWYGNAGALPWGSWGLQRDATSQSDFAFLVNLGGTATWLTTKAFTQKDVWYHVVATYDGAWMRVFVNGANASQRTASGSLDYSTNSGQAFSIGACDLPDSFFTGSIDEVAIYDKALSAARVAAHWAAAQP